MSVRTIFITIAILATGLLAGYSIGSSKPSATTTVIHTLPRTITVTHISTATVTHTAVAPPTTVTRISTTATTTTRTVTETRTATERVVVSTATREYTVTRTAIVRETVAADNATIDVLVDEEYFSKLFNLILNASRSIRVAMYVVKYDSHEFDDPVNILLYAIIEARNRGVDVKIVVDDATQRSYPETIELLKIHGVPVRLDESGSTTMHAKMIIIDGLYVFVGSHNWTESGLSYNREVSVLIKSTATAQQLEEYFNIVWSRGRAL
ncbi:MAG: phospholipase D-like domain-containing protein [Ignisphaera sp.]|nr:phospholipase D-like domain-containing protein [Ignisphaera sp.]MDW8085385.1 phospholipase D-like domain-containing protein [Ignisphaera sp.]